MSCSVTGVCDDHGESKGGSPWWYAMQLCLDGRISIRLYNSGRKIGVAIRGYDQAKVHKAAYEDLRILKNVTDIPKRDSSLGGRTTLVLTKSRPDERALRGLQPFGFFREAGKQEEEE